jgi:hypothetical protein
MRKLSLTYLCILAVSLWSCQNDDEFFTPIDPIEGSFTAEMGASLQNQVYYNLGAGTYRQVPVDGWDIAFQSEGGHAIRVNAPRKSGVSATGSTDFDAVTEIPAGNTFKYDNPDGDLAKTAVGQWADGSGNSLGQVYVINLGNNPPNSANNLGFKKFQMHNMEGGKYKITFANLDGSDKKTVEINPDADYNFTYYSFEKGAVTVEPKKNDWDIVFTGMTVAGGGPPGSFIVTAGVLSNRVSNIKVSIDDPSGGLARTDNPDAEKNTLSSDISNWDNLKKEDYELLGPNIAANTIGNTWVQILAPHSAGNYKVYDWKTYLLKNHEGKVFKIKFLTFKGGPEMTVGYPSFQYSEIL